MKFVTIALVLLLYFIEFNSPVSGYVAISAPNPSRKPGGCYEKNTGHMKGGEVKMVPGLCESASCSSNGSIQYTGCGSIGVGPGCTLSQVDLTKDYPGCCPRLICH